MIHRLATRPARPLRDELAVGRVPGADYRLEGLEARETYEFLRPRPLGLGWTAIEADEVAARLEKGEEVLVRETRSVTAVQRVTDDLGGGMHGPRVLTEETVESRFTRPEELEAFVRVNTGLPPRDETERLAQKLDALAFRSTDDGLLVLSTDGLSDLEAARRLQSGQPLALIAVTPALEKRDIWTVVPREASRQPVATEADLGELRAADPSERVFQGPVVGADEVGTIQERPTEVVIGEVELDVRRD